MFHVYHTVLLLTLLTCTKNENIRIYKIIRNLQVFYFPHYVYSLLNYTPMHINMSKEKTRPRKCWSRTDYVLYLLGFQQASGTIYIFISLPFANEVHLRQVKQN
jgi:hypothetical protein